MPKSIRTIPDAVTYLRGILNPSQAQLKAAGLTSLEGLFAQIEGKQG